MWQAVEVGITATGVARRVVVAEEAEVGAAAEGVVAAADGLCVAALPQPMPASVQAVPPAVLREGLSVEGAADA